MHVKAVDPEHERLRTPIAVLQEPADVVRHPHRLRLVLVAAPVVRMRVDVGQHRPVGMVPKLHTGLAWVRHEVLDRIVQPQKFAVRFVPAVEVVPLEHSKEVRGQQMRGVGDQLRAVPVSRQHLRQRDRVGVQVAPAVARVSEPPRQPVRAHGNRGKAGYRGLVESHAPGQPVVQFRRDDVRVAVGPNVVGTVRVAHDHDDIRTLAAGHRHAFRNSSAVGRILAHGGRTPHEAPRLPGSEIRSVPSPQRGRPGSGRRQRAGHGLPS